MKPLICTVRALRELATGLSPEAVDQSEILVAHQGRLADVLIAYGDTEESQRIVLVRTRNLKERFVPDTLAAHRREALSRMASFAERARSTPLSLPKAWHQYKHDNLVGFFAIPSGDESATRWLAEVLPGSRSDVVFWRTTTTDKKVSLEDFSRTEVGDATSFDADWSHALATAERKASDSRAKEVVDVEVTLPPLTQPSRVGRTFEEWLGAISADQSAFINAPVSKSIRLRGPAGSGKTLALALKAVREVLKQRESASPNRVLVVTHSWALAAQIDESIRSFGVGELNEIDLFPLLEIAKSVLPQSAQTTSTFTLVGEDSLSGKQAQLDQIVEVLHDFIEGDWVTYRGQVSESLRARLDSNSSDDLLALAWDLQIEFGSVMGASGIFPGVGSEKRYLQLPRAPWMLPVGSEHDLQVIFALYSNYMSALEARSQVTSDQVLADFLNYLGGHAWNRLRKDVGYDLLFVDEFHLFSPLERQILQYLTRDAENYPRIFMAVDPRQSPSETFIGTASDATRSLRAPSSEELPGDVDNFELTNVHRFTPEILELVKHVHHSFPALDLGHDWDIDFGRVASSQPSGRTPRLIVSQSRSGEEDDIYNAVVETYARGRLAIAVVDTRQWPRFSRFASRLGASGKFHVSAVSGRTDIEGIGYRKRGLVVGAVEYLAGLQFETVLVAGLPDMNPALNPSNQTMRFLSLLYLALSRAESEVRVFVNEDDGGAAEVLLQASRSGLMVESRGSLV